MELEKSKRNQTDVTLSFTKHLFSKENYREKNLVFSPLSLYSALSVMAAGSEGPTHDELLSFLRFDSIDHLTTFFSHVVSPVLFSNDHLCFANGMWADQSVSLSHSFKQLVATHYKATLASLDFKTQGNQVLPEVNSWVEKETNGHITHLVPPEAVDNLTRLIFANALRFKGMWKHKFDGPTYGLQFHLLNGTSVMVPSMTCKKRTQYIRAFDGFKILRLSYKQCRDKKRRFSMCIFLPDAKDGLPDLIEKLSSKSGFLKGKLPRQKVQVRSFKIPRFNISFTFEASNVLSEVGVITPFSEWDANFTKIVEVNSPFETLYVKSIFHKAFIEVNEEGTEATAATVGITQAQQGGHKPLPQGINFIADHPFLFLIREDFTGTILFIGQVLNPLDGAPIKKRWPGNAVGRSLIAAMPVKYQS